MSVAHMKWYEGPRPGRNDLCPCGSRRKVKRCCGNLLASAPLKDADEATVYLCWEDLWAGSTVMREALTRCVAELDGPWLSHLLARVGWYLGDQLKTQGTDLELQLCDEFLDRIEASKIRAWIEGRRRQKIIHRTNLLALQQINLAGGYRPGVSRDDVAIRQAVQALIKTNDALDDDYEVRASEVAASGRLDPSLAAHFYRIGFYGHTPAFGPAFGRFWAIMGAGLEEVARRHPHAAFDLPGEFSRAFGFEVEELLALGLGLLSYYQNLGRRQFDEAPGAFLIGDRFFEAITNPTTKSRAQKCLEYLALTWDEHSKEMQERTQGAPGNLHQFFSLYRHPLMRSADRVFYPLDLDFCTAQVTDGVYWALLEELSRNGRRVDGDRLRTAFGHAFEWYASGIVGALNRPTEGTRVWLGWEGQIGHLQGVSTPDFLILDGQTLYVVEATVAAVPPATAVSCDPTALRESLERIWLGHGGGSAKVRQLESAWTAARAQRLRAEGLDWSQVRRIEPVFLSLRPVPQHLAIAPLFRAVLVDGGCAREFADDLMILSAEEWEAVCGLRLEGFTWDMLWAQKRHGRHPQRSLGTALFERGLLGEVSPQVRHFIDAAMDRMKALLFPESPP